MIHTAISSRMTYLELPSLFIPAGLDKSSTVPAITPGKLIKKVPPTILPSLNRSRVASLLGTHLQAGETVVVTPHKSPPFQPGLFSSLISGMGEGSIGKSLRTLATPDKHAHSLRGKLTHAFQPRGLQQRLTHETDQMPRITHVISH